MRNIGRRVSLGANNETVSLGGSPNSPHAAEYQWLKAEAKRRRISLAATLRDCCRAYRKLVPEAAPRAELKDDKAIPVDF